MRLLLISLLLLSYSIACSGQVSQYVPAVVGNDGELVNVTVELAPGDGTVFVNIYPRTGLMTQDSIDKAVTYATAYSRDKRDCDVLVTFTASDATSYVEGPSAGTALAVMTTSLLQNKTLRHDTVMTGSIDSSGNVGAVGGLYEKAKSAGSAGARYFITPTETFYEILLLNKIESQYNMTVLEADTMEQVLGFMAENRSIAQKSLTARNRAIPTLPQYDASGVGGFKSVAQSMVVLEGDAVSRIKDGSNESSEIAAFFRNELKRQNGILEQGYLFSAANEAFLNYIDLATIAVIISGNADLARKKGDVGTCLSGIRRPLMTDRNFEWVVGSDLRQAWAYDKLDYTEIDGELLEDEKFVQYNELMYGDAWCNVAKELLSAAPSGGTAIDEDSWQELAQDMILDAKYLGATSEDTSIRLDIAEKSYDDGFYGAAIYDAAYVIAMEESSDDLYYGVSAEEEVPEMLKERRTSLWGRIYQSHAAFLHSMGKSEAAYQILVYAQELDIITEEMRMDARELQGVESLAAGWDYTVLYGLALIILSFIVVLVFVILRRAYVDKR